MAVVSRIAKLRLDNGLGSFREWVATAAVQDTPAGSTVTVALTMAGTGATPPSVPDTFTLSYYADGNLVRSVSVTPGFGLAQDTFHFTSTGAAGGASRSGTIEIAMRATRTTGGPTATYDVETDGTPNTPPTGFTSTLDRGWIRGTTTAVVQVSNVSSGGAKPAVFAYTTPVAGDGGDTIFFRTTVGAAPFTNVGSGLQQRLVWDSGPNAGQVGLFVSTAATSGNPVYDGSSVKVVDNRFPAAVTPFTATAAPDNSPLTGLPGTVFTAITTDAVSVDPRITRRPLFQLDDNTFGTPPMSKDMPLHSRRTDQQGFLAHRALNARGEGVNGLTYTVTLTPTKPGSAVSNIGLVTQTQGGEAGWSSQFLAWGSSLPGGTWTKAVTYTAPADITGASYTVLEAGASNIYTLVAFNSNYKVVVTANHPSEDAGHMRPGLALGLIFHVTDRATGIRVPGALISNARVVGVRNNQNIPTPGLSNGRQYLNSDTDNTSAAWVNWDPAAAYATHPMAVSPLDSTVMEKVFLNTAGWAFRDIVWSCACEIEGVTYSGESFTEMCDAINQHDKYVFDGPGFVGFPTR